MRGRKRSKYCCMYLRCHNYIIRCSGERFYSIFIFLPLYQWLDNHTRGRKTAFGNELPFWIYILSLSLISCSSSYLFSWSQVSPLFHGILSVLPTSDRELQIKWSPILHTILKDLLIYENEIETCLISVITTAMITYIRPSQPKF